MTDTDLTSINQRICDIEAKLVTVMDASIRNQKMLEELMHELKEPLEEFKMRKYGNKFLKEMFASMKTYAILGLGVVGFWILSNLSIIIQFLKGPK